MFRISIVLILFLILTTQGLGYPQTQEASSTSLYAQDRKTDLGLYNSTNYHSLGSYGNSQVTSRASLTNTRKSSSSSKFVDYGERQARKTSFGLYKNIQESYEKKPRFRY